MNRQINSWNVFQFENPVLSLSGFRRIGKGYLEKITYKPEKKSRDKFLILTSYRYARCIICPNEEQVVEKINENCSLEEISQKTLFEDLSNIVTSVYDSLNDELELGKKIKLNYSENPVYLVSNGLGLDCMIEYYK